VTEQQSTPPKTSFIRQPLYRRISHKIKKDVLAGLHPVGSLLPTEQELCAKYSASRYTVREALRVLEEEELVKRHQGRGTEVTSSMEKTKFVQSLTSLSQLYDYASETRLVIERVIRIIPDEDLAVKLGRLPGREWLLAEGVRTTAEGETICVCHVFIHQNFADISLILKSYSGAIHRLVEERFDVRVSEVHQDISTVKLDGVAAQILEQPRGADAILVTRRYLGQGDAPILTSLNWHRLDNFRYGQIIRRE
jgi:GntR family transcriptional regulator